MQLVPDESPVPLSPSSPLFVLNSIVVSEAKAKRRSLPGSAVFQAGLFSQADKQMTADTSCRPGELSFCVFVAGG
jgi:hypothetical protein